jgi:DNA-directed RNA polymerase subunit RPC12/RpoP
LKIAGATCGYLGAVVIGDGAGEYACGKCLALVVKDFDIERLAGAMVRCSYCGCLNEAAVAP